MKRLWRIRCRFCVKHNTHATELIRSGWDLAHVQKRLGHADVQTTINTYVHLTESDLREEYQKYLDNRELAT